MDRVFLFIFIVSFCYVCAKIEIKQLAVPNSIEYTGDNTEGITLDCDFDAVGEEPSELEIMWYHNGETNLIYQWIPFKEKRGDAIGVFKNHLDLDYNVSDNKITMYRALRLINVNTNLTGNYTCKVSSLKDEKKETKQLIIYSPAKTGIEIVLGEEEEAVTCTAQGVFPEPKIDIYISGVNDTRIDVEEEAELEIDDDGFYNVTTTYRFDNSTFPTNPVKFVCDLNIPGTNYSLSGSVDYYREIESIEYNGEDEYYSFLNDSYSSTEENFNMTEESDSAMIHSSRVYIPALLMLVLLIISK